MVLGFRVLSMARELTDLIISLSKEHKTSLAIGLGVFGLSYALLNRRRDLPPGPVGWPILGASREIASGNLHLDFLRMGQDYGDIFSLYASDRVLVGINSYELIKEAFVTKADTFSNRSKEFDDVIQLHDEIFTRSYSEKWRQDKKFIISSLKAFGFSSGKGEANIKAQIDKVVDLLIKKSGQPIQPKDFVYKAAANIIASILFSGSWDYDDPALQDFITMTETWAAVTFGEAAVFTTKQNPLSIFSKADVVRRVHAQGQIVRRFYRAQIEEHIATLDPNNPRDFIDAYLLDRGAENVDFKVMEGTVMGLSPDPLDTLGVAVLWCIMFIVAYPDVQRRLQAEVDEVIGHGRQPNFTDRHHLHYTEAVCMEVLRMRPSFAVTDPHTNPVDVKLNGYLIPAESNTIANVWAVHYNPRYFPDPEKFNPDRFIGRDGKFKKSDYAIPFSIGRRTCPGEQLSKMELFYFVTSLMQRFNLSVPEGAPTPDLSPTVEGNAIRPKPFNIIATPRFD